jgi:hypothetical protein
VASAPSPAFWCCPTGNTLVPRDWTVPDGLPPHSARRRRCRFDSPPEWCVWRRQRRSLCPIATLVRTGPSSRSTLLAPSPIIPASRFHRENTPPRYGANPQIQNRSQAKPIKDPGSRYGLVHRAVYSVFAACGFIPFPDCPAPRNRANLFQ